MKITKEKYNELSARIDAGEFLAASPAGGDALPALPDNADEDMKSFYADCQSVLELNKQKTKAMEAKMKAIEEVMKTKEMTSIASDLIVDFNGKLEKEYHDYKEKTEETMANLKDALTEARKISADALERNKNLAEELEQAKRAQRRQVAASHRVERAAYGRDIPPAIQKYNPDDAKKAQEKIATDMIQSGVNYASNLDKVKEEDTFLCIKLLTNIVDNSIKGKLNDIAGNLSDMIIGIISNRDKAKAELQEKLEEEKKQRQNAAITNNFYDTVGQAIGSADRVGYTNNDKTNDGYGRTE